uniref:Uncharacterized protein n=1 Tax=Glossina pallidipes TaxID=7398 RepID=A0A1A9ZGN7_GLOPL
MNLFNQPSTTYNSAPIKNHDDTTRKYLLALNNISIETESWGLLLLHILIKKLDLKTYPALMTCYSNPSTLSTTKKGEHTLHMKQYRRRLATIIIALRTKFLLKKSAQTAATLSYDLLMRNDQPSINESTSTPPRRNFIIHI